MDSRIDVIIDIRGFNRFYTNMLGLMNANIGSSDYSLTEARIIYEISKTEKCSANQLSNILRIDTGYLSRTLKKLEKEGVLERHSSEDDARINEISLTEKGHELFEQMNNDSNVQIASLIESLTDEECHEISKACDTIKKYFTKAINKVNIRLSDGNKSDVDYIIDRQLFIYSTEREFTSDVFRNYVIDGVHNLVNNFDDSKDCIMILECNGIKSGCIAVTHLDNDTAQLRYFFIESELRGIGAGRKMLTSAIEFCKNMGYKKAILWTVSAQATARRLYSAFGFEVTEEVENEDWGSPVLEECWERDLTK